MSQTTGDEQKYETSLVTVANAADLVASCVVQLDVNNKQSSPNALEFTLDNARSMAVARFKNTLKIPAPTNV